MIKKILACLVFLLSISCVTLNASSEAPVTRGNWAKEIVDMHTNYGAASGHEGLARPVENITVAEFAAVINDVMNYQSAELGNPSLYPDLDWNAWYAPAVRNLINAGVIVPKAADNTINPTGILTRELAAVMLARAFSLEPVNGATAFSDNNDIAPGYRPLIKAMNEGGYVQGYSSMGKFAFRPTRAITVAEVTAMLDAMTNVYIDTPGTYTENVSGNVLIANSGVMLSGIEIKGRLLISSGAAEVALDDVTLGGDMIIRSGGTVSVKNSRLNKMIVDDVTSLVTVETAGASTVEMVEMRNGGFILANQNEYSHTRQVVIPQNFPDDRTVTLSGSVMLLTNKKGATAVRLLNANTSAKPKTVAGGKASFTAQRPTNDRIEVSITSPMLGTAHVLILNDKARRPPTNEELRDVVFYEQPTHVFDYASFRVFPGNTEVFTFFGANQVLDYTSQGHTVYVMIRNDLGNVERLDGQPLFFEPSIEHMSILSAESVAVNFKSFFPSASAVEEVFEMYISTSGVERKVSFVAFNMVEEQDIVSHSFKLTLIYGERIKHDDIVLFRPKNPKAGAGTGTVATKANLNGLNLSNISTVIETNGNIIVSGKAPRAVDIMYYLTDEYFPDYHTMANAIASESFSGQSRNFRKGTYHAPAGTYYFTEYGFANVKYYYLYVVTVNQKDNALSDVTMYVLKR